MAFDDAALDFAYKYPFSSEARQIVSGTKAGFDAKALNDGGLRVQRAMDKALEFQPISMNTIKLTYLISYVYARMIASALKSPVAINSYATSEALRAGLALRDDASGKELLKLSAELGLSVTNAKETFIVPFEQYLSNLPRREKFALSRQMLKAGNVYLNKELAVGFLESRIKKEVLKGLPIPAKELPKEVTEHARKIRLPVSKNRTEGKDTGVRYRWIEKLIETPIPGRAPPHCESDTCAVSHKHKRAERGGVR